MMNLDKRLSKLEQQSGGLTRYIIARPHSYDDNLIHVLENGKPESDALIMSLSDFQAWEREQPSNVTIIRLVYSDE